MPGPAVPGPAVSDLRDNIQVALLAYLFDQLNSGQSGEGADTKFTKAKWDELLKKTPGEIAELSPSLRSLYQDDKQKCRSRIVTIR